uniref:Uncharacterized protein n=1 Tax=Ditylenchus dipsaci TaxID=166011 RepID=A0A915CYJ1_9BILA
MSYYSASVSGCDINFKGEIEITNLSDENEAEEVDINVDMKSKGPDTNDIRLIFKRDSDGNQSFLEYFENTWVGRAARRTPKFPLEFWNSKAVSELGLPRTNISVESWHHQLQS